MKQKLLSFLFLRFVPHRAAVGIALFAASQVIDALTSEAFCADAPTVCKAVAKVGLVLGPILVAAGIRDKDRT